MDETSLRDIQNTIGYFFKNKVLLEQAFTRKSYAQEHSGIMSNEQLEFYGDAALDFYVTLQMYYEFSEIDGSRQFVSSKNENELTDIRAYHVNSETLSLCIDNLGLQKYLIINEGDRKNNVSESESVKEDLFEAIVGAVAVDSNWSLDSIKSVCSNMLIMRHFDTDYVSWLYRWCENHGFQEPRFRFIDNDLSRRFNSYGIYRFSQTNNLPTLEDNNRFKKLGFSSFNSVSNDVSSVQLTIPELNKTFTSEYTALHLAKMDIAKQVYFYVRPKEFLSVIGTPSYDTAVNQIHELFQKGYIQEPEYSFSESHDDDGNPVWECELTLAELDDSWIGEASSKKDAKKEAAIGALCDLLNLPQPEDDYQEEAHDDEYYDYYDDDDDDED